MFDDNNNILSEEIGGLRLYILIIIFISIFDEYKSKFIESSRAKF